MDPDLPVQYMEGTASSACGELLSQGCHYSTQHCLWDQESTKPHHHGCWQKYYKEQEAITGVSAVKLLQEGS